MIVFNKRCRTARSSWGHRTESVSVMGNTRSAAVCSTGWTRNNELFSSVSSFWSEIGLDWARFNVPLETHLGYFGDGVLEWGTTTRYMYGRSLVHRCCTGLHHWHNLPLLLRDSEFSLLEFGWLLKLRLQCLVTVALGALDTRVSYSVMLCVCRVQCIRRWNHRLRSNLTSGRSSGRRTRSAVLIWCNMSPAASLFSPCFRPKNVEIWSKEWNKIA